MPEFTIAPDLEPAFRPFRAFPLKTDYTIKFASPGNARLIIIVHDPARADMDSEGYAEALEDHVLQSILVLISCIKSGSKDQFFVEEAQE
ncbi:hypothetical protein E2562_013619 [Oryza meyeriana var. granulata]|uniref:Uncharacterized protein n=1 Tax=Oryza meyeriana var. granulata TaxID=110450 RepID=A0A6G1C6D0_9ORYZ|nr:hypothetical protein E2562_013619 [Oryza meyeriana var. granulata]